MQHRKEAIPSERSTSVDLQERQSNREALSWIARDDRPCRVLWHVTVSASAPRNGLWSSSAARSPRQPASVRSARHGASIEALPHKDHGYQRRHAVTHHANAGPVCEMPGRPAPPGTEKLRAVEMHRSQSSCAIHSGDIEGSMRIARDERLCRPTVMPTVDRPSLLEPASVASGDTTIAAKGFDRRSQIDEERGDSASVLDPMSPRRGVAGRVASDDIRQAGSRVSPPRTGRLTGSSIRPLRRWFRSEM